MELPKRKSEQEKLEADFEKTARALAKVLVRHYQTNNYISGIAQYYVWENEAWNVKISHPNLGQITEPMQEGI